MWGRGWAATRCRRKEWFLDIETRRLARRVRATFPCPMTVSDRMGSATSSASSTRRPEAAGRFSRSVASCRIDLVQQGLVPQQQADVSHDLLDDRLKNVMADTANAIGEGGASKGIAKGQAWAALGVRGLSNAADVAGTAIGEFAAAVRTGNFDLQQAAALNAKYDRELRQAAEVADLVAKAQDGATQATQAQVRAVDNAIAGQERQTTSNLAVRASYGELIKGAAQYTDVMSKIAAARQAEAATLTALVNVYGTEAERRQAAAEAASMQARASKDLADARNAEAIIAQSYSLRLQEEALQRRDTPPATQDQIKAAQQSADAKRAEADQAIAATRSKQLEVAAAQTAAEAYKDNAARVYELRGAAAEAARELERLVEAQRKGKASSDDVSAAQARAAGAIALYRDDDPLPCLPGAGSIRDDQASCHGKRLQRSGDSVEDQRGCVA
jgi:hypothetical protein